MLTLAQHTFTPYLPPGCCWIKGQLETGEGGFVHWQVIVGFEKAVRLKAVKLIFGNEVHAEGTRSEAADAYVHKDESSVVGTRFELGAKKMKRNSETDWDSVWESAKSGDLLAIPSDVRIRTYHTLKRIRKDYDNAPYRNDIVVNCFVGVTGSGKSHKAFIDASVDGASVYIKGSTTKWWDSYRGEANVIIDEFRGQISVEHLLKWFDRYPCYVEEKGGQLALHAVNFWVCSNLPVHEWYPHCDPLTLQALERRLTVTEFHEPFNPQQQ